jgi:phage terminase small subunit
MAHSKKNKLTPKQAKFVEEYLIDLNGTQAAIRAGYSAKRADAIAYELLRKPEIQESIRKRRDELSKTVEVTQERIVLEMSRLAFMDIRNLFNEDGSPIAIKKLSDAAAAGIVGIEVVAIGNAEMGIGRVVKYKLPDKNKALENLARILGYLDKDKNRDQDADTKLINALSTLAERLPV